MFEWRDIARGILGAMYRSTAAIVVTVAVGINDYSDRDGTPLMAMAGTGM